MRRVLLVFVVTAVSVVSGTTWRTRAASVSQPGTPVVLFDQAHFNQQRLDGNYAVFKEVVQGDGLQVVASTSLFTREGLSAARVLVIANALGVKEAREWFVLPTPPAFNADEVRSVVDWVRGGGSLFLIVDHTPFPAANAPLAAALGFTFSPGSAVDQRGLDEIDRLKDPTQASASRANAAPPDPASIGMLFTRSANTLKDHPITAGRKEGERIDSVATMGGSAFQSPPSAQPLLVFPAGVFSLEPLSGLGPNNAPPDFRRVPVAGWHQAAALISGKGRIVVVSEAGMFSRRAQQGPLPGFGIDARQNRQLLLNIMRWLLARL